MTFLSPRTALWFTILSCSFCLLCGGIGCLLIIDQTDRRLQDSVVQHASQVAQGMSIRNIRGLTGAANDENSPGYQRVKRQFTLLGQANDDVFSLCLLGRHADGSFFVLLDSQAQAPGQPYTKAEETLRRVFASRQPALDVPTTDNGTRHVTVFVPLTASALGNSALATTDQAHDVKKSGVSAVLAVNMDAKLWTRAHVQASLPIILTTLVLLTILLGGGLLLRRRPRTTRPPSWMKFLEASMVGATGLVLTIFATWEAHGNDAAHRLDSFSTMAASKTLAIAELIWNLRDFQIEGLANFHAGSSSVSMNEFTRYCAYLTEDTSIQAWEWIPVVSDDQRALFEKSHTAEVPDFEIWETNDSGKRVRAAQRATYYPVARVVPLTPNQAALGYDLGSEPSRRAALEEAARTRLTTGSDPVALIQEHGGAKGMLILRPVFDDGNPDQQRGFALAVLKFQTILDARGPDENAHLDIRLLGNNGQETLLGTSRAGEEAVAPEFTVTRPVLAFGKVFLVTAHAEPEFGRHFPSRLGWFTALTGLLLSMSLTTLVQILARRRDVLEELVRQRTSEIREQGERIRSIFQGSPNGLQLFDHDGRCLLVNPAGVELIGRQEHQILGERFPAFFPEPTCAQVEDAVAHALAGKQNALEVEYPRNGEAIRHWHVALSPILDNGKTQGFVGIVNDISARVRTENALRDERWRLASIIEGTHVGTWEWNVQTGETVFNETWARIVGHTLEELAPVSIATWMRLAHPDDMKHSGELLDRHFAGELPFYDCECRMRHKDGRWVWVHDRGQLRTRTLDGAPQWMFGTHQDITARKEAEEKLQRAVLEQNVLLESLRLATEAAEEASRMKSEFLANMSHEIRTPMNAVIGLTGLLLETALNGEQRHFAESIRSSGELLLSLINDILDFSKVEAGRLELEHSDFDLLDLLDDVTDSMAAQAHEKNLELLCSVESDTPSSLQGDPRRLRQILNNLVSNAIKFTPAGEIVVHVSAVEDHEDECVLTFHVRDTGIGIPEDKIGILFDKFRQIDASTTRKYGGTGLGLAICRQLVELMGGEIGVSSQEGRGSDFWFTVRLGKQDRWQTTRASVSTQLTGVRVLAGGGAPDSDPIETRRETRKALGALAKGVRVLVVEDNAINQDVALRVLKSLGVHADAVGNGSEALQALVSIPYSLVLMDIQMPEMDGYEATRRIRAPKTGLRPDLPIIAMTAHAMQEDRKKCSDAGMNDYISKPINTDELANVLHKWLPVAAEAKLRDRAPAGKPEAPFPALEDVDSQQALAVLNGDVSTYTRLLIVLREEAQNALDQLDALVREDDAAAVAALTHSLAGTAGNLRVLRVHEAAKALNSVSRNDRIEAALVENLRDALRRFVAMAASLTNERAEQPHVCDLQSIRNVLDRVEVLVASSDIIEDALTTELNHALAGCLDPALTDRLKHALQAFDYQHAQKIIADIRSALDSPGRNGAEI